MRFLVLIFIFLIFSCNQKKEYVGNNKQLQTKDSINLLMENSKDDTKTEASRILNAQQAVQKAVKVDIDSLYIKTLLNLALVHYQNNKLEKFKSVSLSVNKFSKKVKDTLGIAKSSSFLGFYYLTKDRSDSSYYYYNTSAKMFKTLRIEDMQLANVLNNMAIIQKNEKDYIAGEVTSIEAMKIYKRLDDDESLSSVYNNLGIISNELERYEKAIEYHSKSLDYAIKSEMGINSKAISLNNIGIVYFRQKQYQKAIEYYNRGLAYEDLPNEAADTYAMLLDNVAHAEFLSGNRDNFPEKYFIPFRIRDSLEDVGGIVSSCMNLAEYYLAEKDTATSKKYVKQAINLSNRNKRFGGILKPLALLSDIDQSKEGLMAAKQYIKISDSLQRAERTTRNQFARIRFETDEIVQKNKEISKQKDLFIAISAVLVMFGIFVYIIRKQQERNKELKFSKAQQEKNEEIYNLMLSQQRKLEEGRQQEKKRISQELHDGVLSKLFGTRLNLDSLNFKNDKKTIQIRGQYIDQLKSIEKEIRQISHDLNAEIYDSNLGYTEVISNLIASQAQLGNLEYKFQSDSQISWEAISNKVKIHLYRIIQEALQNINKHANARNIKLIFEKGEATLHIAIHDDGIGFDMNKMKNGIGLKNIKSRVKEIGGKLHLNSTTGGGTNININITV